MSEQDDKGKSERVRRAYSTSNMIEQLKRRRRSQRRQPLRKIDKHLNFAIRPLVYPRGRICVAGRSDRAAKKLWWQACRLRESWDSAAGTAASTFLQIFSIFRKSGAIGASEAIGERNENAQDFCTFLNVMRIPGSQIIVSNP